MNNSKQCDSIPVGHPLSPRASRFIDEYLIDANGKQAAIRAGYSVRSAESTASRLLRNAKVSEEIALRRRHLADRCNVTALRVVQELARIGFANMIDYIQMDDDGHPSFNFSALTRDQAAAIGEVIVDHYVEGRGENARQVRRVRLKLADKRAALVDLGKHLGLFKEQVVHSGPTGGPIEHALAPPVPVRDYAAIRREIAKQRARRSEASSIAPDV